MKSITYCAVLFALFLFLSSFTDFTSDPILTKAKTEKKDKQINFIENSLELALKKAKAEHKYIFVDAYAVWCGPCKLLKTTTFKDRGVADFFNANFVNLSMDMEKGEGVKLAETWSVEVYPTLLVLDSNGNVVLGQTGYIKAAELLEIGHKVFKKSKP